MYTPSYPAAILFLRRLRLEAHADWKFRVRTHLLESVKNRRLAEFPGLGIAFLLLALSLSTGCGGGQVDTDTPVLPHPTSGRYWGGYRRGSHETNLSNYARR